MANAIATITLISDQYNKKTERVSDSENTIEEVGILFR